jgi:hypothetical protein
MSGVIPRSAGAAALFAAVSLVVAGPVLVALYGAYLAFGYGDCVLTCRQDRHEPGLGLLALAVAGCFAALPPLAVWFHRRGDRGRALLVLAVAGLLVTALAHVAGLI